MNSEIAKRILIFSSVIGCILGVLTIIPFLNFFSFIAVIFLLSPFVLYFCEKFQYIGILNVRQTMLYAYIIGFFGFLGFSVSFLPLATIIGLIYKNSFYMGISMLFRQGFFILLMMDIFVALLFGGLMNAFGALIYYQIKNMISGEVNFEDENFDIEIK